MITRVCIISVAVEPGQHVVQGQELAVMEAMKMQVRATFPSIAQDGNVLLLVG